MDDSRLRICSEPRVVFVVKWSSTHVPVPQCLPVRLGLVLGGQFDHVVDSQDRDGRFRGELERFDLGDGRLEDAALLVVTHHTLVQVQPNPSAGRK